MIFRKGEIVCISSSLSELKEYNGSVGRVTTVKPLETTSPFVVVFFQGNKKILKCFEHTELVFAEREEYDERKRDLFLKIKMFGL